MKKIITFGELMLRLAPDGYLKLQQADRLNATYGGGEANVAVSLAQFGRAVSFVSRFPKNDIGIRARNTLRGLGVGTEHILFGGERMGIYFLEKGAAQRASKVIYDRAGSSFAASPQDAYDFPSIFADACWFHVTGITPALSPGMAAITLAAAKAAKEKGLTVSCDLNYRKKLWTREEAKKTMTALMPYVDVLIANEEDCADVFGIRAAGSDITGGTLSDAGYAAVAAEVAQTFGIQTVAITLRGSMSANDNRWRALLYTGGKAYFSKEYLIHIVDRVGGGDSFGAGLIYAQTENYAPQDALEFAVAASCLKHSIEGDFSYTALEEVLTLMKGDGTGRVQR